MNPVAYRLEWKPGDYCYYTVDMYEHETYRDGARVHGLFLKPQPDCPADINVYKGQYFVQAKYYGNAERNDDFVPLYLGPMIHEPLIDIDVMLIFPSFSEDVQTNELGKYLYSEWQQHLNRVKRELMMLPIAEDTK